MSASTYKALSSVLLKKHIRSTQRKLAKSRRDVRTKSLTYRPLDIVTHEAPEGFAPLPLEELPVFDMPVPPPSPWFASDIEDEDHESILSPLIPLAKEHTV